jgi:hypothetical protein
LILIGGIQRRLGIDSALEAGFAGQFRCLPDPTRESAFVELVVLVDVEVAALFATFAELLDVLRAIVFIPTDRRI